MEFIPRFLTVPADHFFLLGPRGTGKTSWTQILFFTRRALRELAAHPKFFFFDAGVFRANRPTGPLDSPAEIDGAALEGLVAQHLRAWCDYTEG